MNSRRNFTPSDDALIREQPATGIGINTLEKMLRISRGAIMRRAGELGVSLVINGGPDTRSLSRSNGLVDPLLERLKRAHGDRKSA